MNNEFFEKLEPVLAAERLDAYRQDDASPLTTLSRYLWNMALCESLYSPLQMAEVALRNRVHAVLAEKFSADDWYTTSGMMLPRQKKMVDVALNKFCREDESVPVGKVLAELHFGFWTGFFNKAHSRTGIGHLLTQEVFGYASKYERDMKKLDARWNRIRNLRNRVFHHERIIHWKDLSDQHTSLVEAVGWINPELREMVEALDRFVLIHSAGIEPWKEKIRKHWPKENF
ncbi:MAG: hypothetical protein ABFR47_04350 [Verrucomicrobiota bacterium]